MRLKPVGLGFWCMLVFSVTAICAGPPQVKIARRGDGYVLLRNGEPYFVKGAVNAVLKSQ